MSTRLKHLLWKLPPNFIAPGELQLTCAKTLHYLLQVLRLKVGSTLWLKDPDTQRTYLATILHIDNQTSAKKRGGLPKKNLILKLLPTEEVSEMTAPAAQLTVITAMPKGGRADWLLEKLCELGVKEVQWLLAEHSVRRPNPKQERYERLLTNAAQQCQRADVLKITGSLTFQELLAQSASLSPYRFLASPQGPNLLQTIPALLNHGQIPALTSHPVELVLLIGPEGGFTKAEEALAIAQGYQPLKLSPYILRLETAAICGAALLLAAFNSINPSITNQA